MTTIVQVINYVHTETLSYFSVSQFQAYYQNVLITLTMLFIMNVFTKYMRFCQNILCFLL